MSEIIFNASSSPTSLQSQIDNFQTTLALLNQQVIVLQTALQQRDQQITELQNKLANSVSSKATSCETKKDDTLTVVGAFINLYKFLLPGKDDLPQ